MSDVCVHMLGDSTLDNFVWVANEGDPKKETVEGRLQSKLNTNTTRSVKVINHAYDGFTTSSVLKGDAVGRVLGIYPHASLTGLAADYLKDKNIDPKSETYFIHPLEQLKKSISDNPKAIHYVVISVGGNDFRERLSNPVAMLREIPQIQERYLRIIQEVKSLKNVEIRPILMFQYRLDAKNDQYRIYNLLRTLGSLFFTAQLVSIFGIAFSTLSLMANKLHHRYNALSIFAILSAWLALSSLIVPSRVTIGVLKGQDTAMATLGRLMELFYQPILAQAKKEGIPILDLPNTFNPNKDLYVAQIEPNKKGSELIAEGITHIIENHTFESSESKIYSKRDSNPAFSGSENPGLSGWQVAYPQKG